MFHKLNWKLMGQTISFPSSFALIGLPSNEIMMDQMDIVTPLEKMAKS